MSSEKKDIDEIIENKLYLGSYDPDNITALKEKGIKKILSVMDGDSSNFSYKEHGFNQKIINITDYSDENIIQYFGECLKFILGEEKILVHCMAGASRSATIVIAYLMWIKRWKFNEALAFAKKKRPIVFPNDGFKEQLKMFEKLLEDNDYDIDKINFKEIKWVPPQYLIDAYNLYKSIL